MYWIQGEFSPQSCQQKTCRQLIFPLRFVLTWTSLQDNCSWALNYWAILILSVALMQTEGPTRTVAD